MLPSFMSLLFHGRICKSAPTGVRTVGEHSICSPLLCHSYSTGGYANPPYGCRIVGDAGPYSWEYKICNFCRKIGFALDLSEIV